MTRMHTPDKGPRTSEGQRAAARSVAEEDALWTIWEATTTGCTAEAAARLLYANLGGALPLTRCREAAASFPVRSRQSGRGHR